VTAKPEPESAADKQAIVGAALLDFDVDLEHYKKFPVLDPSARYLKGALDQRQELRADPDADLPDYGGPFREDLRFTDFSRRQLVDMLVMNDEYLQVWIGAWLEEAEARFGRDEMLEIEWLAWRDGMAPKLPAMLEEFLPPPIARERLAAAGLDRFHGERPAGARIVEYSGPFAPDERWVELTKEELVAILLGSHEYMLQCNQGISLQIVLRHGLDDMFAIAWDIWSAKVLPVVKDLKAKYMKIDGTDVAAFMKDLQIDATALPGKGFDLIFEMPESDVGIMTFNKCLAADMWEALGRPDILEKGCHSTCPASIEETAKLYNPNMKVDILAIPPRVDSEHVCCKWKLSMRTPDDPEYVPVAFTEKPAPGPTTG
jgi:hypothetical protein